MIRQLFTQKGILNEFLIILSFILITYGFIEKVDKTLNADGIGYYDYLPSIFIHHDLLRKNKPVEDDPMLYNRIVSTGVYVDYNGFKVNKYPCGTALLQLPFFTVNALFSNLEGNFNDGYQNSFQKTVLIAAIFYLFLSILFLKKILILYGINKKIIVFCQILLALSTSVTQYATNEAGFSHVYSLFAITAFIYFVKYYFEENRMRHFLLSCVFLGLIFILRQANILIILFVPFIAASKDNLLKGIATVFSNIRNLLLGVLLFVGIASIQLTLWYLQTGQFFVYSYQGEGFNFLDPHFYSILFSYKKGLFVYTPILFIALFGLVWFVLKKYYYLLFTWLAFFALLTYVLSSWWSWFYGCSYGLRAYVDYYTIFFIPFAMMLHQTNKITRIIIIALSLPSIPLNIIQTYQYNAYILHWIDMDKDKYWKVFLKTNDRFKGLFWKNNIDLSLCSTVYEINLNDISIPKNTKNKVLNVNILEIPDFNKVSIIQLLFDNDFQKDDNSEIVLSIDKPENNHNYYWHKLFLIRFYEKDFNEWQTGLYNYEFSPINDTSDVYVSLEINTGNRDIVLKNVRLKFLNKTIGN